MTEVPREKAHKNMFNNSRMSHQFVKAVKVAWGFFFRNTTNIFNFDLSFEHTVILFI